MADFPFPMDDRYLIGLSADSWKRLGKDPAREIVPVWFGFRTTLASVPGQLMAEVSGRSQFKLFINGRSILFGPCRSHQDILYYDTLDIAPYLKEGENRILMQVFSYPQHPVMENQTAMGPNYLYGDDGGPAVFLKAQIGDKDPMDPANWRIWPDEGIGFNAYGIFLLGANECVDAEKSQKNPLLKETWNEEALLRAEIVQPWQEDPWGVRHGRDLQPRPIKLLYRKEKCFPNWKETTIPAHSIEQFVLDAGELTTAYFRIGLEGGKGAKVRLTYAESYFKKDKNGKVYKEVRDDPSGYIDGIYDEVDPCGEMIYEPFRFRTFRFIEVRVETREEALTILPMSYVETAYPLLNCKKPLFEDPQKEKLYDVAFRTLQLCAHDTYEDCPYYEQLMYTCDTRLEMLFTYAATEEMELPRQAIRLYASSLKPNGFTQARFPSREEQIIPAFSLYFVLMLEDYVKETGDLSFVRPYIPIGERIVETFLGKRLEDGLLAPQGHWDYFDWAIEWQEKVVAATPSAALDGESALQNLFFVYACQSFCQLLKQCSRVDLAEVYEQECREILQRVEERCFDEEKGLYKEGPSTLQYSQHTQIFAVLCGLAEGEKAVRLMEKVLEDKSLVKCSFMQGYYLFRALEKVGMYEKTEGLWKTWQEFIDLHCTTFPETPFDPRSDCHAWSALPLLEFAKGRGERS